MNERFKIKVCGMRDEGNIRQLSQLPIHYMGFIFYPKSPRYAGEMPVRTILQVAQPIKKVGVFVNASVDEVITFYDRYRLDLVQLHGYESPDFCFTLKNKGIPVVKSFAAKDITLSQTSSYQHVCDYFLFDTPTSQYGGSGKKFDWSVLQRIEVPLPFFLSGGLGPDDVQDIQQFNHPQFFAIDINSRFEIQPGMKDIGLIKRFIERL
ncbi:MAG: phosphoribosylanthranilate isomerase [Bacteroidales bacterium]